MSAYVCNPRHVDYLVAYAHRYQRQGNAPHVILRDGERDTLPETAVQVGNAEWGSPDRLMLGQLSPDVLGQIIMTENVRSVRHRYPSDSADDLPGPIDQSRIFQYTFRPIPDLRSDWALAACQGWKYQSCETPDHAETLAWRIVEAIERQAIRALTEDCPWEITEETLKPTPTPTREDLGLR